MPDTACSRSHLSCHVLRKETVIHWWNRKAFVCLCVVRGQLNSQTFTHIQKRPACEDFALTRDGPHISRRDMLFRLSSRHNSYAAECVWTQRKIPLLHGLINEEEELKTPQCLTGRYVWPQCQNNLDRFKKQWCFYNSYMSLYPVLFGHHNNRNNSNRFLWNVTLHLPRKYFPHCQISTLNCLIDNCTQCVVAIVKDFRWAETLRSKQNRSVYWIIMRGQDKDPQILCFCSSLSLNFPSMLSKPLARC